MLETAESAILLVAGASKQAGHTDCTLLAPAAIIKASPVERSPAPFDLKFVAFELRQGVGKSIPAIVYADTNL